MLIGVSTLSLSATTPNPVLISGLSPRPAAGAAVSAAPANASPGTSAPASTSSHVSAPANAVPRRESLAGGGRASENSSTIAEEIATSFSTTVGGKQYTGSVEESDGEYTASVPNLAGATATGSSEQAAENNLAARIDELV